MKYNKFILLIWIFSAAFAAGLSATPLPPVTPKFISDFMDPIKYDKKLCTRACEIDASFIDLEITDLNVNFYYKLVQSDIEIPQDRKDTISINCRIPIHFNFDTNNLVSRVYGKSFANFSLEYIYNEKTINSKPVAVGKLSEVSVNLDELELYHFAGFIAELIKAQLNRYIKSKLNDPEQKHIKKIEDNINKSITNYSENSK